MYGVELRVFDTSNCNPTTIGPPNDHGLQAGGLSSAQSVMKPRCLRACITHVQFGVMGSCAGLAHSCSQSSRDALWTVKTVTITESPQQFTTWGASKRWCQSVGAAPGTRDGNGEPNRVSNGKLPNSCS